MGQMTITAYTDENFSSEYKSALELPINPDKVKFTKGIQYAEDKQLGSFLQETPGRNSCAQPFSTNIRDGRGAHACSSVR